MIKSRKQVNSPRVPVYRDSGFELYDAATTTRAFESENENEREPDLYIYSRYRNPTVVAAEDEIIQLEKSAWALLFQSGMAAIDTAVSIFQTGKQTKPWLFFSEIYGGTLSYCDRILKYRRGIDIQLCTPVNEIYDLVDFKKTINRIKPGIVYIETISNPLLIVADVPELIEIAKKSGSKVIVDNTFATPLLFKPLEHGADIVMHSVTKYLSGHGNISAGVLCGNDRQLMKAVIEYRKHVGHMFSPDDAYRLSTQIKSFELRFRRQCENASRLAEWLANVQVIQKVFYPGLENHPTNTIARKLFGEKGFGGMITFNFAGDNNNKRKRRDTFIRNVAGRIRLIPTLGDSSTILMPVEPVWGSKYPEPGMIRLSTGFENYENLIDVISEGMKNL